MCNLKKENENAVGADLFLLYESNNAAITLKVFLLIHFNLNYGAVLFPHPPKQTWFMTLCKRIPADHQNKNQWLEKNTTCSVCKQTRFSMFKHIKMQIWNN